MKPTVTELDFREHGHRVGGHTGWSGPVRPVFVPHEAEMLRIENRIDSRLNPGHQVVILRPFQIGTLFEFRRLMAHGNEEDG